MESVYILGSIVVLVIDIAIASKFASIAEEKGYNRAPYFWGSLLLGIIIWIVVAALPDLTVKSKLEDIMHYCKYGKIPIHDTDTDCEKSEEESAQPSESEENKFLIMFVIIVGLGLLFAFAMIILIRNRCV